MKKPETIVIAEDSLTQATQLKYILENNGYTVFHGKDGNEALELVNENKPSLVISDIVMPEMEGFELCKLIKQNSETKDIPVILLTSLTHVDDVFDGIESGADSFINKPYSEKYLLSHIEDILEGVKLNQSQHSNINLEVSVSGKKHFVSVDPVRMVTLLISTYESAINKNTELNKTQQELNDVNNHLEEIVKERTAKLLSEIEIRKHAEEQVRKLNRVYAVLSNVNQAIVRIHNVNELFNTACSIAINDGKFQSAWIGLMNEDTFEIGTYASSGEINGLVNIQSEFNPVFISIKSGNHIVSNNLEDEDLIDEKWKRDALALGFKSFAILPIKAFENALGCFCLYSSDIDFFDDKEISLLDEMAEDISFALEFIQKESERKQAIEDLIAAKEKAEESDRLKSAFLANMSHEIRTPMNGILGFARLLDKPDLTGERQHEYIDIINQSGARMLNIINDIIDISRIESGTVDLTNVETNINEQTEFIFNFFKPETDSKGLEFSYKNALSNNEVFIKIDKEKLLKVLTNLVKNAIKYTDKGSIEFGYNVRQEEGNSELEFFVKDTGIGIPANRQEAIFERFIQADISDTRAFQGAGLGLSISKAYAEMLGGKIRVESQEEDLDAGINGHSIFYFTIPFHSIAEKIKKIHPEINNESSDDQFSNLKILIVEDDSISSQFITEVVSKNGNEILYATDGNKAVDFCKKDPDIDLILMDIKLPHCDGYEATRRIRQFNTDVIIIAQTAYGLKGDKEKSIEAGCNDYISKPINKDLLRELIGIQLSKIKSK